MMILKLIFIFISVIVFSEGLNKNEDNIDSVIDLLLNGDSIEVIEGGNEEIDTSEDQPIFEEGIWRCGKCDVIDDTKLIYSELNEVDTNIEDGTPFVVQVGLNMENMQCVTVAASSDNLVYKESGLCSGSSVTLTVSSAKHFVVNVYGY